MNPDLSKLQAYPFEKLLKLKEGCNPPQDRAHIALSIGEPKHEAPQFVVEALKNSLTTIEKYPITKGLPELREAICQWTEQRFKLPSGSLNPEQHAIPVNGTREALFAFTQAVVDRTQAGKKVLMPNPFYQIYEGAALLAGAEPYFLNCDKENNYLADFDSVPEEIWQQCQLLFICSPGNPTGVVLNCEQLKDIIALADKYDFTIASDECYSEIYMDENNPPPSLLQACAEMGRTDYKRCVIFHSLSKRSNLPGLRSGFVAGDAEILQKFLKYRTYHGCALPLYHQYASIAAWQDEEHVKQNRDLYRAKFDAVLDILKDSLELERPEASFYLWPRPPISDTEFARGLYDEENLTVLPGSFLAREQDRVNPGEQHVRMALVAPLEECIEAAHRIKRFAEKIKN